MDEKLERMKNGAGFIAALDQSGGSTPKALQRYGIEAAQTHAGAVGQHALGGILKQVVVFHARDDLVVAHALQAQRGDDTHLGQQKLLAREHASQRYFFGVIHRTHSKGSGLFICIGAMQTCLPIIPFKYGVVRSREDKRGTRPHRRQQMRGGVLWLHGKRIEVKFIAQQSL